MKTIKADDRRRVQIPGIKAGQVFDFQANGGVVTLTPVKKAEPKEPFPEGSLAKYWTREYNEEMRGIAKGTVSVLSVSSCSKPSSLVAALPPWVPCG